MAFCIAHRNGKGKRVCPISFAIGESNNWRAVGVEPACPAVAPGFIDPPLVMALARGQECCQGLAMSGGTVEALESRLTGRLASRSFFWSMPEGG